MNRITRRSLLASALLLALATAFAEPASAFGPTTGGALLSGVDAQKRFPDSDLSYDMELVTTGGGRGERRSAMRVFRRDAGRALAALVLSPESERGEGYLRQGDNLWFFDVETGAFVHRVLSDSIGDSEMDSGDIEPDCFAESYGVEGLSEGKVGAIEAIALELREKGAQAYPRVRIWVRKLDGILLKEEYFGASGRLIRYALYPTHVRLGTKTLPSKIVYVDALDSSRRTTATISSPSFEGIPDTVFSKAFLERAR
jgi:hypothetical protein